MLPTDTLAELKRRLATVPILPDAAGTPVSVGRAELERLLPHRAPMLLLDAIEAVDIDAHAARGRRYLAETDPAFVGHFPEEPTYPSVLVVEAMGQLAFTLIHFACGQRLDVPHDVAPPRARAVHIHGATFIEPFTPGDTMTLHAQVVERDATMLIVGQAWKNDTLAAFAVLEMYVAARTGRGQPRPHRHTATRHAEQLPRRTYGGPLGHLALEGFLD